MYRARGQRGMKNKGRGNLSDDWSGGGTDNAAQFSSPRVNYETRRRGWITTERRGEEHSGGFNSCAQKRKKENSLSLSPELERGAEGWFRGWQHARRGGITKIGSGMKREGSVCIHPGRHTRVKVYAHSRIARWPIFPAIFPARNGNQSRRCAKSRIKPAGAALLSSFIFYVDVLEIKFYAISRSSWEIL